MQHASIFNDALGPVMRGPSSSHSAAACRIGLILRDLMHGEITNIVIDYDPNGSLVTTHESQGTDMGLYGGLMGWQADDPRMIEYREELQKSGIKVTVNYLGYDAPHPNYYRISISNERITHTLSAISTGGGMMEVVEIDGSPVSICGDYHEYLIYGEDINLIRDLLPIKDCYLVSTEAGFVEIKSLTQLEEDLLSKIRAIPGVNNVCYLRPVVPVLTSYRLEIPFIYCSELYEIGKSEGLSLWELGVLYESARGSLSEKQTWTMMESIVDVMGSSIREGLKGKEFEDRILPVQSLGFEEKMTENKLLDGGILNTITLYITALMENKSAMGVFVAAPTAGSCGALPGTIFGAANEMNLPKEEIIKAMFAAGIIGVFIAQHSTFAAEVAGCQAETGAGASMAAAGLVTLAGGSLEQCIAAASFALQNSLGIVCDPIGNRVEAPCLGKNILAGSNALSSANMALANYDPLIPFDEVVQSMKEVGDMMAHELTCTGLGGLAATPTGQKIKEKLQEKAKYC